MCGFGRVLDGRLLAFVRRRTTLRGDSDREITVCCFPFLCFSFIFSFLFSTFHFRGKLHGGRLLLVFVTQENHTSS